MPHKYARPKCCELRNCTFACEPPLVGAARIRSLTYSSCNDAHCASRAGLRFSCASCAWHSLPTPGGMGSVAPLIMTPNETSVLATSAAAVMPGTQKNH